MKLTEFDTGDRVRFTRDCVVLKEWGQNIPVVRANTEATVLYLTYGGFDVEFDDGVIQWIPTGLNCLELAAH